MLDLQVGQVFVAGLEGNALEVGAEGAPGGLAHEELEEFEEFGFDFVEEGEGDPFEVGEGLRVGVEEGGDYLEVVVDEGFVFEDEG